MPAAPLPPDESIRLEALNSLGLWDTEPEERFDRITRMATRALSVANACINLVGEDRVFTKSAHGHPMNTPRGGAFCAYTILEAGTLVVPDAPSDARFADFPQVKDKPFHRFYAGVPLCAPNGDRVGTLCVSDRMPRIPSDEDLQALADFALMAQGELNMVELNPDYKVDSVEQEQLRVNEERFREIADVPGTFIWETTLEGKTTYVSERVTEVLGFTEEEVLKRGFFDGIISADIVMATARFFMALRQNHRFSHLEFRYETKDGRTIWLAARGAPRRDVEGTIIGYRGFVEEVTESRTNREEQAIARTKAEKMASKQTEYLTRLNQDIRGPVNALVGLAGQLLSNRLAPEVAKQAGQIRDNADKLLAIITDLNDFAKIESGLLEFENHPFNLQLLVEDAINSMAPRAIEKGLELHWHLTPDLPQGFDGDETRLRQILVNLLTNGIVHTKTGDVSISVSRAESEVGDHFVLFSVWDTGPGFSDEIMETLFERQPGDTADDMGLSISRSLAELMGGRIWAESELGKGSGFHVAVPLAEATPPNPFTPNPVLKDKTLLIAVKDAGVRVMLEAFAQDWGMHPLLAENSAELQKQIRAVPEVHAAWIDEAIAMESSKDLVPEMRKQRSFGQAPCVLVRLLHNSADPVKNLPTGFVGALPRPVPYREAHVQLANLFKGERLAPPSRTAVRHDPNFAHRRPMRILLAEDNAISQKALAALLTQYGYRPDLAHNGREVLEALDRQPYDLILMDLSMPEMDGLEASQQIRERFSGPRRPWIIGMAPGGAEVDRPAAQAAGIDSFLTKPVRGESLEPELIRASDNIGQVVDFSVIARFLEMTGTEPAALKELVEIFTEQTFAALHTIEGYIEARRPTDISKGAHQLKQNCANFGAERMQQLCDGLMAAGKAGEFPLAKDYVERLQREFKRVKRDLDAFVLRPRPVNAD